LDPTALPMQSSGTTITLPQDRRPRDAAQQACSLPKEYSSCCWLQAAAPTDRRRWRPAAPADTIMKLGRHYFKFEFFLINYCTYSCIIFHFFWTFPVHYFPLFYLTKKSIFSFFSSFSPFFVLHRPLGVVG
jgi:hypothetical protein